MKERGRKGRAEKPKSSERGRMEWRTGKEYNSGTIGITYRRVFYRNDNEFYAQCLSYTRLGKTAVNSWIALLRSKIIAAPGPAEM